MENPEMGDLMPGTSGFRKFRWEQARRGVAVVSLATIGQSLNKAAMRMLGTLLGAIAAFVILALFAQERWGFMLALSVFIGFCTYATMGSRLRYFWDVGGSVCAIIAVEAGSDPVFAFDIAVLRAAGHVTNHKRTYRLYREEGLQVRTKRRKKLTRPAIPMLVPDKVNQRWSMDFVSDQLADGRRFRVLNVVDDYSRECVLQVVDFSVSG